MVRSLSAPTRRGARRARVIFREIELHRGFNNGARPFPVCFEQTKSSPGEICAIDWAIIRRGAYARALGRGTIFLNGFHVFVSRNEIFTPSYISRKRDFFPLALSTRG